MSKILVIAPHADDEVLGVGGYLLHESIKGSEIRIVYAAIGGKDCRQDAEKRLREVADVCNSLNARWKHLFIGKDG